MTIRTVLPLLAIWLLFCVFGLSQQAPTPPNEEAITGAFILRSNGFTNDADFQEALDEFQDVQTVATGLGPVFNNNSCVSCHFNPVTGGGSQITELRSGHFNGTVFVPSNGGSLIHTNAIHPAIQERVLAGNELSGLRITLSLMGDGYIECIENSVLINNVILQPLALRGTLVLVPVLEAPNGVPSGRPEEIMMHTRRQSWSLSNIPQFTRVGRFGWKGQQASLLSFAADAYINEMGITSPLQPVENLSNGRSVALFDSIPDPEDTGGPNGFGHDVELFTLFMRSLEVPPRDEILAATPESRAGEQIFRAVGCAVCHTPSFTTAAPGTPINGNTFIVPPALGSRVIFPFSDFALHDVGTGDGIVMNGPQVTSSMFRTTPLWGLRSRTRLMHDGLSFLRNDAILRHAGQATPVIDRYRALSTQDKEFLITFLRSL